MWSQHREHLNHTEIANECIAGTLIHSFACSHTINIHYQYINLYQYIHRRTLGIVSIFFIFIFSFRNGKRAGKKTTVLFMFVQWHFLIECKNFKCLFFAIKRLYLTFAPTSIYVNVKCKRFVRVLIAEHRIASHPYSTMLPFTKNPRQRNARIEILHAKCE